MLTETQAVILMRSHPDWMCTYRKLSPDLEGTFLSKDTGTSLFGGTQDVDVFYLRQWCWNRTLPWGSEVGLVSGPAVELVSEHFETRPLG